jgi:hypothetical protein
MSKSRRFRMREIVQVGRLVRSVVTLFVVLASTVCVIGAVGAISPHTLASASRAQTVSTQNYSGGRLLAADPLGGY